MEAARHPHGPDAVAEVALQFAEDGGGGEGGEGGAADRVEAVDRVDQAEVRHLQQVVEGLAGAAVAQRQVFGEGEIAADQLLAGGGVALVAEAAPEQRLGGQALAWPVGRPVGDRSCLVAVRPWRGSAGCRRRPEVR